MGKKHFTEEQLPFDVRRNGMLSDRPILEPAFEVLMRALLVEQGRPRVTCNSGVKAVRRLFSWAASQELIPVATSNALATVDPLLAYRTTAPELPPVRGGLPQNRQ